MALQKPRTREVEIAALSKLIDQHKREMAEIELDEGVQHGNISPWLIASGRTLLDKGDELLSILTLDPDFAKQRDTYMRELKRFKKYHQQWWDARNPL